MNALSIHIPGHDSDHSGDGHTFDSPHGPLAPSPALPGKPPRELAPFLRQLREMLERESPAILRWTPDGRAFEILDLHQMTHVVLPKYFKHAKYASFQRQLNYFSFRKWTKSKSPRCTFANPHFVRAAPELTWQITRKRDASQRRHAQSLKRQRAQSFDPSATTAASATATAATATATSATTARGSHRATPRDRDRDRHRPHAPPPAALLRSRAASESSLSVGVDALRLAAPVDDGGGLLLQWIDDQFPSVASLALLDGDGPGESAEATPPVWTPYTSAVFAPGGTGCDAPAAGASVAVPPPPPRSPGPWRAHAV